MSEYVAPVREMRFVLDEIAGIEALTELPGFEELSLDLVDAILGEAGRFSANELAPINHSGDISGNRLENGVVYTPNGFKEAYAKFVEAGWGGVAFDSTYGGQGLPRAVSTAVNEMVAAGGLIILGIGFVLLELLRIRVANYLPALVIAPLLVVFASRLP